jgi:hypothetical protein
MRRSLLVSIGITISILAGISGTRFAAAALTPLNPHQIYTDLLDVPSTRVLLAYATFTGVNNTIISTGTPLDFGGTWTVHAGTWRISGNRARTSTITANASMTVNTGNVNVVVFDTLTVTTSATTRKAGLVLHRTGGGAFLYVLYENAGGGTVKLYESNGGITTLATGSGVGNIATVALEVHSTASNQVIVKANGTTYFTYNLTPAQITTYKTGAAGSLQGVISNSDNSTRHDNFRVEQL